MSNDRILLRSNLVNVTDYQAEHTWPEGQNLIKDVYQVMSYLNGMYNGSSKAVQLASDGSQLVTLQPTTNKQQVRLFDNNSIEYSASNPLKTTGAGAITSTLQASTALVANGNSTILSAVGRLSGMIGITVTAVSGAAPTADFYVQYWDGIATWYDVYHYPQVTTTGNYVYMFGGGGNGSSPPGSVRVRWAIAGTTPSFTTAITLAAT